MGTSKRYPVEVRERAVRLVLEHRGEYETEWAAILSIAEKTGVGKETLRQWVRRAEIDDGLRPGVQAPKRSGSRSSSARTVSCAGRTKS
jgi:transposase